MMPDGRLRTYYKGDHQTWTEIVQNVILPDGSTYCESNWISANHEAIYSPEKRVKAFLDRCAFLMSLDNHAGLESAYKAMSHKVREIPASECPSAISDILYSDRMPAGDFDEDERFKALCERLDEVDPRTKKKKPKAKIKTRYDRIEEIGRLNPNASRTWVVVDSNNCFVYKEKEYHIPSDIRGYVNSEKLDSMDRVLVVDNGSYILFYDQSIMPIDI